MQPLRAFIERNFKFLFYLLLSCNLIVLNLISRDREALVSPLSPKGIISLELNTDTQHMDSIITTWSHTVINHSEELSKQGSLTAREIAVRQTKENFFFIVFYTLFLLLLIIFLSVSPKPARWILMAIPFLLLAAGMDVTENIFLLQALHLRPVSPWTIFIPSLIKWALLLLILLALLIRSIQTGYFLLVLRRISFYLNASVNLLVQFRIVVFGLLFLFIALYFVDQGQDLLLVINSSRLGPTSFLAIISFLALLNWYLPKYYDQLDRKKITFKNFFSSNWSTTLPRIKSNLDTARLLGTLSFLLPAVSILQAMRIFRINYLLDPVHPLLLLLLVVIFYQIALAHDWIRKWFMPGNLFSWRRYFFVMGFILGLIILFGVPSVNREPWYLAYLSLDLFLLSFAFLVFVTLRTCVPSNSNLLSINIAALVLLPGLCFFLLFLVINLFPTLVFFNKERRLFTLPVIVCGIMFYTIFFSYLLLAGKRLGIRFITLLFLMAIVISLVRKNPLHQVTLVDAPNESAKFAGLSNYAVQWFHSRKKEIDSFNQKGKAYPVYLINAYGGGVRAAAWTSLVVSELEREMQRTDTSCFKAFQHYVFSYSGASGGTIGASVLCASRFGALKKQTKENFYENWKAVFENDYLTPVATALMGRDIWNSSLGVHLLSDRAFLQEEVWEHHLQRYDVVYDQPFGSYWYGNQTKPYELPLLFANSYHVDSGLKAIAAPLRLQRDQFPGTIFVEDLINDKNKALKLSTASFLSARFPFISPTAKFNDYYHFMDGGLKENSGAETSRQIMAVLDTVWKALKLSDSSFQKNSIRFYLLSLPNAIKGTDSVQKAPNPLELTAPLTALLNNWIGNTTKAALINAKDTGQYHYIFFEFRPEADTSKGFRPILPLGWQISDDALDEMKSSLNRRRNELLKILTPIK